MKKQNVSDEFVRGAREGWMRALTAYVDMFAESNPTFVAQMNDRFPLPPSPEVVERIAEIAWGIRSTTLSPCMSYRATWKKLKTQTKSGWIRDTEAILKAAKRVGKRPR